MTVRQGRILAPGANDMKAGLLAGAYAVDALLRTGFDAFQEVVFFCNGDEEVGSKASFEHFRLDAADADAVLVLEAARQDGAIVSARKGGGRFRLTVTGRSAHAGVEPERGANAIVEMAHQVLALSALDGIRPGATVSVGVVAGGTVANVVPDKAVAEIDVRVARAEDVPVVEAALRNAARITTVPRTETSLDGRIGLAPMTRTPAVAALVDMARAVAAELGFGLRDVATGGMSDANRVAGLGRPVLDGLGPVGGLDHGPDEYVELQSIVPRTALLAGLIRRALEAP
jgi:glutamate carboxypeptidase